MVNAIKSNAKILRLPTSGKSSGLIDVKKLNKLNEKVNKFRLLKDPPVEAETETTQVDKDRAGVYNAIEATKIKNPNDFLLSAGEEPELDGKRISNNKNFAGKMALIQAIDSLAGAGALQANQEEAVVAPSQFQNFGLGAVENIRGINDRFDLDMKRFADRSLDVENKNRQTLNEIDSHNKGVDVSLAETKYQDTVEKANKVLEDKRIEEIKKDDSADKLYQAGLRYISNGYAETGLQFLKMAGLVEEEIDLIMKGIEKDGKGKGTSTTLSPADKNAIRHYYSLQEKIQKGEVGFQDAERVQEEIEFLQREFGQKLFAPRSEWDENFQAQPGAGTVRVEPRDAVPKEPGHDLAETTALSQTIHTFSNYKDYPTVDASTNEGVEGFMNYLADKLARERDPKMQNALFLRGYNDLIEAGMSDEQIEVLFDPILGGSDAPEVEGLPSASGAPSTQPKVTTGSQQVEQRKSDQIRNEIKEIESKGSKLSIDEFKRLNELKNELYLQSSVDLQSSWGKNKGKNPENLRPDGTKKNSVLDNVKHNTQSLIDALGLNESDEVLYQKYLKSLENK